MYICNYCGETFEDCKIIEEHHPYGSTTAIENWYVCPYCNDTDFEEAQRCERCGEFVADLQEGLCDICHSEVYE